MLKSRTCAMAVAVSMAITPGVGAASVFGSLGHFNVINDTGFTAHGFEIDLEGLHSSGITDTFGEGVGRGFPSGRGFDPLTSVERYGSPTITEYSNGLTFGTKITYQGLFDSNTGSWDYGTPRGTLLRRETTAGPGAVWATVRRRRVIISGSARPRMRARPRIAGWSRPERRVS